MPDFITLSCPSCGGKLEITSDIERFACAHCGTEHLVRRTSSIVSLAPVEKAVEKISAGVDKTASELAIQRLERETAQLESELHSIDAKVNWERSNQETNLRRKYQSEMDEFTAPKQKVFQIVMIVAAVGAFIFTLFSAFSPHANVWVMFACFICILFTALVTNVFRLRAVARAETMYRNQHPEPELAKPSCADPRLEKIRLLLEQRKAQLAECRRIVSHDSP